MATYVIDESGAIYARSKPGANLPPFAGYRFADGPDGLEVGYVEVGGHWQNQGGSLVWPTDTPLGAEAMRRISVVYDRGAQEEMVNRRRSQAIAGQPYDSEVLAYYALVRSIEAARNAIAADPGDDLANDPRWP